MGAEDPAAAGRQDRGPAPEVAAAVERALREHWGRLLALLTGSLGSLDVAEEALQDAYAAALTAWARDGVPERPPAYREALELAGNAADRDFLARRLASLPAG